MKIDYYNLPKRAIAILLLCIVAPFTLPWLALAVYLSTDSLDKFKREMNYTKRDFLEFLGLIK